MYISIIYTTYTHLLASIYIMKNVIKPIAKKHLAIMITITKKKRYPIKLIKKKMDLPHIEWIRRERKCINLSRIDAGSCFVSGTQAEPLLHNV